MIASPYGSKELQRKRKALVDAKKHEAKARRLYNEKKRELDAQYNKLCIERAIYENLKKGIESFESEKVQHANIVSILQTSMNSGDDSTKHSAPSVVSPVDPATSRKEIEKDIESAMADDSWVNEYLQNKASSQVKPVVAEDTVKTEETETETETKRLISEGSP